MFNLVRRLYISPQAIAGSEAEPIERPLGFAFSSCQRITYEREWGWQLDQARQPDIAPSDELALQHAPRVDRPPQDLCTATLVSLPATQGQR